MLLLVLPRPVIAAIYVWQVHISFAPQSGSFSDRPTSYRQHKSRHSEFFPGLMKFEDKVKVLKSYSSNRGRAVYDVDGRYSDRPNIGQAHIEGGNLHSVVGDTGIYVADHAVDAYFNCAMRE